MAGQFSLQATFMGLLVAFVGFASSFAVVLQGLRAVGASEAQAASGLMALAVAMGLVAIFLSAKDRLPISCAWSTPGAALLASTGPVEGGFSAAVGAFILSGLLLTLAGLWRPLARWVSSIPPVLSQALVAGILFSLCLAPFKAIGQDPMTGLPILLSALIAGLIYRTLAVPAALIAFILVVIFATDVSHADLAGLTDQMITEPIFISPVFSVSAFFSIALPLFLVTMASQNVPGIAILSSRNYPLKPRLWFTATGLFSLLSAPFGGHAVNLAALTAAMCAGEDAHPDPGRRYWSAVIAGIFYILFGVLAAMVIGFVTLAPVILIEAVAGIALMAPFAAATMAAFSKEDERDIAALTFICTASGITLFGISGAFWGLILGAGFRAAKNRLAKDG